MKSVTVSNVRQLRRAVADPTVDHIEMDPNGTYRIRKPIVASRPPRGPLTINGNGATIDLNDRAIAPGTYDPRTCPICHQVIVKEAHGGEHPSPGDHDPAFHVAAAYGSTREETP